MDSNFQGYDVFISYSRKDKNFAKKLQSALEKYRPPADLNVSHRRLAVFRDEDDLIGSEYHKSIESVLTASRKMVVLCSPNARKSEFVSEEIQRFANLNGSENIIPVLIAGKPNNEIIGASEEEKAFPEALLEVLGTPLAVNYVGVEGSRKSVNRHEYYNSWFTLLANIYGLSRSEIEQRERVKLRKRRILTTSTTGAIILILSVLTLYAFLQRNIAKKHEAIALKERDLSKSYALSAASVSALSYDTTSALRIAEKAIELNQENNEAKRVIWKAYFSYLNKDFAKLDRNIIEIATSPGSDDTLALVLSDGPIELWSIKNEQLAKTIDLSSSKPSTVKFTVAGGYLAVGYENGTISFIEIDTLTKTFDIENAHKDKIRMIDFSPDGKFMVSVSYRGDLRVWDLKSRQSILESPESNGGFEYNGAKFSPDNKMLIAFGPDGFSVASTESWQSVFYGNHDVTHLPYNRADPFYFYRGITAAAFSDDGKLLITGDTYGALFYWDLDKKMLSYYRRIGHGAVFDVKFVDQDKTILTHCFGDKSIKFWDVKTHELIDELKGHQIAIKDFELNKDAVLTMEENGLIKKWAKIHQVSVVTHLGINFLTISPDSTYILYDSSGTEAALKGATYRTITGDSNFHVDIDSTMMTGDIREGSRQLAVGSSGGDIYLLGMSADKRVMRIEQVFSITAKTPPMVSAVKFIPNKPELIAGYTDGATRVWNINSGELIHEDNVHGKNVTSISISAKGDIYTTASWDATFAKWQLSTHTMTETVNFGSPINMTAITADGNKLLIGSYDTTVAIWDLSHNRQIQSLKGHMGPIHFVCFSPDETRAFTAVASGAVHIWDIKSGEQIGTIQLNKPLLNILFLKEKNRLITFERYRGSRSYPIDVNGVLNEVNANNIARKLSPEEEKQYRIK